MKCFSILTEVWKFVWNVKRFSSTLGCYQDFNVNTLKIIWIRYTYFYFFYRHKKKVLGSRKFSTSGFRWIYIFWDFQNPIWPFFKNICLSSCMSPKFCGYCISSTNELMKLYIQLNLHIIWYWLDFVAYRSRSSDIDRIFWFLWHRCIGQNYVKLHIMRIIFRQSFWKLEHLLIIAIVRSCIIFVCMRTLLSHVGGREEVILQVRHFLLLVFSERTPQNILKEWLNSYICGNLNQTYRIFIFNKKKFEIHSVKKSSGRQQIDFFRICMVKLCWF